MIWPRSSSKSARHYAENCGSEHNRLKCIAAGILGNAADAEDIVQQAYTIAITKNQKFPSQDKFLGWLVGIIKFCALNHRKKNLRRKTSSTDPTMLKTLVEDKIESNEASFQYGSNLEDSFDDDVLQALNALSEDSRICLLLKIVEKLSYKEIADYMAIPEGTAMSMVHRARASLRKSLENHEFANKEGGPVE